MINIIKYVTIFATVFHIWTIWTNKSLPPLSSKQRKALLKQGELFCITKIKCICLNAFAVRVYN